MSSCEHLKVSLPGSPSCVVRSGCNFDVWCAAGPPTGLFLESSRVSGRSGCSSCGTEAREESAHNYMVDVGVCLHEREVNGGVQVCKNTHSKCTLELSVAVKHKNSLCSFLFRFCGSLECKGQTNSSASLRPSVTQNPSW